MRKMLRIFLVSVTWMLLATMAARAENVSQEKLNPVPGPQIWVEEYLHIKPEKFDRFMEIYRERIYPVLRTTTGYRGQTVITSLPPKEGIPKMDFAGENLVLGPPETLFPAHPGINLDGTRTDRMVHLGSLLKGKFNVIIIHHIDSWKSFESWIPEFQQNWRNANNGQDMWDSLQDEFFSDIVINHWDTVYRVVETSFIRD